MRPQPHRDRLADEQFDRRVAAILADNVRRFPPKPALVATARRPIRPRPAG